MLAFRPVTDLAAYHIAPHCNAYGAYEGDRLWGLCTFQVEGYEVRMQNLECTPGNDAVPEGLVRSALHFAGNRGAYIALFQGELWDEICKKLPVHRTARGFEGEIPEILMGCCHNL